MPCIFSVFNSSPEIILKLRIIFKAVFADFLLLMAVVISSAYRTIFTILSSIEMPLICSFSRIPDASSLIPRMNKYGNSESPCLTPVRF